MAGSYPCAYIIKHYAMKTYGGAVVYIHVFLTSALVGVSGQLYGLAALPPRETAPGINCITD
jgi:hypothetical protein